MKPLLHLLTVGSFRELIRYKSFLFLILLLIAADTLIHRYGATEAIGLPSLQEAGAEAAAFVFEVLPSLLLKWFSNMKILALAGGLFLLKQIISLWPSSDMRRMHRQERKGFGMIASLLTIRYPQVLLDAIAVSGTILILGGVALFAWLLCKAGYAATGKSVWLYVFVITAAAPAPLGMAGFSYSSKLAVMKNASFTRRLKLFFRLFTDIRIWPGAYLFYAVRMLVEFLFVAAIPAGILMMIDSAYIRIPAATIVATPVYSFLKMASFKFFLYQYRHFEPVRNEYADYYNHIVPLLKTGGHMAAIQKD